MYLHGKRSPDKGLLSAVGVLADVRLQAVMWGGRAIMAAVMDACPKHYPRLVEPRLAGIAVHPLDIEGIEEIEREGVTKYLRQCRLCREPRK